MEDPLRESSSFEDCSRIYCLQGPFNQHVWRMTSVAHRLLGMIHQKFTNVILITLLFCRLFAAVP